PETTQKLLSAIYSVGGISRINLQGQNLPQTVPSGPGSGIAMSHPDRKLIQVGEQVLELQISVGRIQLQIDSEEVRAKVKEVCEQILPFPFEFRDGYFLRSKATVSDYAKFGSNAEAQSLGLVDPKAKLSEKACILSQAGSADAEEE
ncbi:MAG: methyl-coenzyme M reductase operon protein D, partial [Methanosarcinales archaeon]|nr:methyl-coenzyme M reductase operon protein D [Methanosarcinales archaeon]